MRRLLLVLPFLLLLGFALHQLSLGGLVWSAHTVEALALVTPQGRQETRIRQVITDGVQAAQMDMVRRILPISGPCDQLTLEFLVRGSWVRVPLSCANGLLFDYLPPDAWQVVN